MSNPVAPLRFVTPQQPCSYVSSEISSLEYRVQLSMEADEYLALLRRGWRRHGAHFFRPACPQCSKCRSLRIDVHSFRPAKSQRRCLKRNAETQFVVQPATVTSRHVALYNAWHRDMTARRGWPVQQTTPHDYAQAFLIGDWSFAYEMQYFQDGRLVGVGLVDLLEDSMSSVYFYHDPAWRSRGPGTFSILCEIQYARQTGRRYLYLGYAIRECPSMAYKFRYRPHEVLDQYVSEPSHPVWSTVE